MSFQNLVVKNLRRFGVGITRRENLDYLRRTDANFKLLRSLANEQNAFNLIKYLELSEAQLKQDLFVLSQLGFKKNGYFVEFGAADGRHLSNSYLLEKEFGWDGILAEPARVWHAELKKNRNCHISHDCVWKESGSTVTFSQTEQAELSTISDFSSSDSHAENRKHCESYQVNTISLLDLLQQCNAPKHIDYLSIDTESSEYDILNSFDFSKYTFDVITCEHNYSPNREKISDLLEKQGYKRVHEDLSLWDDWYLGFN